LVVVVSTAFLILAVLGAFVIWAPAVFVSTAAAFVSGVGGGRFFRRYTRDGGALLRLAALAGGLCSAPSPVRVPFRFGLCDFWSAARWLWAFAQIKRAAHHETAPGLSVRVGGRRISSARPRIDS
jgi:hypothetical protein